MIEELWGKKFSIGTFISVLLICVSLFFVRYKMLQKSSEPNGLDGYFYALQAKSLVQIGHLENPSYQCGYYLCGLCSYFCGDAIKGVKLWSAISSAGISLAIYLVLGFATGSFYPAILGFLLSAASPTVTQMCVNYINNQTGVMFLLFYVALLVLLIKKHPKSLPGRIALYSGALILFALSALSHKITLVYVCLVTVVFALPLLIRHVKENPSIHLAVELAAIIVFLVALIPAYRFSRLHSPRFANAFSLPSLPYFNATMKKSLGWGALEMSIHAVLIYILAIVMLVKKRPGRYLLLLVPAIFFPFLNLDSDMGLRLWMNAVPLAIPLELYFVRAIFWEERNTGGEDGSSNHSYRLRTVLSIIIFLLCFPLYFAVYNFTPDFYDPESDPPYRRYREIVRDIELDDDSLLIAHLGLNHVYTYEKDLKDALNWLPNFEMPVEKIWRLAYGTSESHIRNVLRSNGEMPEDSDGLIRKIDYEYTLIREDLWQKYLLLE
ncbi:MAG: hypothetical protein J6W60_14955, partial [Treponema sp.]|nr:hypothetical protein [Treponema sp.]